MAVNPDDVCAICGFDRENHGDAHHKFSVDGQLIPLEPPKPPRQDPPKPKGSGSASPEGRAFATLMEVLTEKQILDAKDVIRIFSGQG